MKAGLYLMIIIVVVSCNNEQSASTTTAKPVAKDTATLQKTTPDSSSALLREQSRIDSVAKKIEADSTQMRTAKRDIWGKSTEGGELIKFYEDKNLAMAMITYFGEMGQSTTTYYHDGDKVIKIKNEEAHYNKPMYLAGSKVESIDINLFYNINGTWMSLYKGKLTTDTILLPKHQELLTDYNEEMNRKR